MILGSHRIRFLEVKSENELSLESSSKYCRPNWATQIEILQALLRYRVHFKYLLLYRWFLGFSTRHQKRYTGCNSKPRINKSNLINQNIFSTKDVSTGQKQHVSKIDEVIWPNQHQVPAVFIFDFILYPEESATILNPSLVSSSSGRKRSTSAPCSYYQYPETCWCQRNNKELANSAGLNDVVLQCDDVRHVNPQRDLSLCAKCLPLV